MSKAAVAQPVSPLRQFWLRWRFHLNVLLILIPLGFMPRYFADVALFRAPAASANERRARSRSAPGACAWRKCVSNRRTTKAPPAS